MKRVVSILFLVAMFSLQGADVFAQSKLKESFEVDEKAASKTSPTLSPGVSRYSQEFERVMPSKPATNLAIFASTQQSSPSQVVYKSQSMSYQETQNSGTFGDVGGANGKTSFLQPLHMQGTFGGLLTLANPLTGMMVDLRPSYWSSLETSEASLNFNNNCNQSQLVWVPTENAGGPVDTTGFCRNLPPAQVGRTCGLAGAGFSSSFANDLTVLPGNGCNQVVVTGGVYGLLYSGSQPVSTLKNGFVWDASSNESYLINNNVVNNRGRIRYLHRNVGCATPYQATCDTTSCLGGACLGNGIANSAEGVSLSADGTVAAGEVYLGDNRVYGAATELGMLWRGPFLDGFGRVSDSFVLNGQTSASAGGLAKAMGVWHDGGAIQVVGNWGSTVEAARWIPGGPGPRLVAPQPQPYASSLNGVVWNGNLVGIGTNAEATNQRALSVLFTSPDPTPAPAPMIRGELLTATAPPPAPPEAWDPETADINSPLAISNDGKFMVGAVHNKRPSPHLLENSTQVSLNDGLPAIWAGHPMRPTAATLINLPESTNPEEFVTSGVAHGVVSFGTNQAIVVGTYVTLNADTGQVSNFAGFISVCREVNNTFCCSRARSIKDYFIEKGALRPDSSIEFLSAMDAELKTPVAGQGANLFVTGTAKETNSGMPKAYVMRVAFSPSCPLSNSTSCS